MTETQMDTEPGGPERSEAEEAMVNKFLHENQAFWGPDYDIQHNHHIAERTELEERILSKGVDSHLMSEIKSNLQAALDEAFDIAEMTVATPAAQCGDMSTAYFTTSGDMSVCSQRGVAGFSISLHFTLRYINKYFTNEPTVGIREGDGFLINDCHFGGIHSPDQHLFMPIFHEDVLIGWTTCAMHEGEIGAKVPGGMGPDCESIWDEGFRGSPIKIVENYKIKRDLATLVQNNSREPQIIYADLKARLSSCIRTERRMKEQVELHGMDNVVGCLRSNIEYMQVEARRRIAALPDGTMRLNFYIDDTMREKALIKCVYNFTIKGDQVTVDMRGTAPELYNRPINSLYATQTLGILTGLTHYIWPDLPSAQAVMDSFEVVSSHGTLSDSTDMVPVSLCMQPLFKAITAAEIAFAKFYHGAPKRYAKTKAGWFNQPQTIIYGGINQHHDSVGNMCGDLNGMAGGAKMDGDGEHSMSPNFGCATDLGESELAEADLPFIYAISKRLWPNNTGFGKYRSGAAYQFGLMRFGEQPFGFQAFTTGSRFPSTLGIFGGYACPTYNVCRIRGKNLFEEFKANPELFKTDIFTLMNEQPFDGASYEALTMAVPFEFYPEGELFVISQGAGGGYGDVLEREAQAVIRDVEENLLTVDVAQGLYKVVFDPETLILDEKATQKARAKERKARLKRGLSWDDFVKKHVRDEPPADVPFYGSWNGSEELYAGPYGKGLPGQLPPIMLPDPLYVANMGLQAELAATKAELDKLKSRAGKKKGKKKKSKKGKANA